jgi:hypothetical protein
MIFPLSIIWSLFPRVVITLAKCSEGILLFHLPKIYEKRSLFAVD